MTIREGERSRLLSPSLRGQSLKIDLGRPVDIDIPVLYNFEKEVSQCQILFGTIQTGKTLIHKNIWIGILLVITGYSIAPAKNFKAFFHTGGTFPASPVAYTNYKAPSVSIGGGLSFDLSKHWTLRGSFLYSSLYSRDTYVKEMQIGDSIIDISWMKWYMGGDFDSFYHYMLDSVYYFNKKRVSPYVFAGAGFYYEKWVYGWTVSIGGSRDIFKIMGMLCLGVGAGAEINLEKEFGMFIEAQYIVNIPFRDIHTTKGILPVKPGFFFRF